MQRTPQRLQCLAFSSRLTCQVCRAATKTQPAAQQVLTVLSVDKFPRMVDYVVPSGVRIADADRVRLGAHLAAGTTVLEQLNGKLNANALSQQFAAQFTPSPILDLRMNNAKYSLEQVLNLYIDRYEKQL